MSPTIHFTPQYLDTYRHFVLARHSIWERRVVHRLPPPWTDDHVLQMKFTNMFRVLDYGSQYVVRELLDGDYRTTWFRCFLYRYTNHPPLWDAFRDAVGRQPVPTDLAPDGRSGLLYDLWTFLRDEGHQVFSKAYQIQTGMSNTGMDKLSWVLQLTAEHFVRGGPHDLVPRLSARGAPAEQADLLRTIPRCGDFMTMQVLTDFGWSPHGVGTEDDFVLAGPGAVRGLKLLGVNDRHADAVHALRERWQETVHPRLPLPDGTYRALSSMDTQNTLCEFDKYVRWTVGGRHTRRFAPKHEWDGYVVPDRWLARPIRKEPA